MYQEEAGAPLEGRIYDFAYAVSDTTDQTAYQKYMFENYYELDSLYTKPLNKNEDIIWDTSEYPDVYYAEVMDSLYIKKEDSRDGVRTFNTKKLKYNYSWYDVNSAVANTDAYARINGIHLPKEDFITKLMSHIQLLLEDYIIIK